MVNVIHRRVLIVALSYIFVLVSDTYSYARSEKLNASIATCFIENKGQVIDQHNNFRSDIDYKIPAGGGLNIFVSAGKMHYMWSKSLHESDESDSEITASRIATYRLDVFLDGANTGVQPIAENKTGYYENYYTAGLHNKTAHAYSKITYKNIYNKIDWLLYLQDGGLKYDFIIHPGGDVNDIKVRYEGADELKLTAGDLNIITPYGSVTEKAPFSYKAYTDEEVKSGYELSGNVMSFELEEYAGKLVIDPSLEWASYMGGTGNEYGYGIVADTARNIYIVGRTESNSSNVATTTQSFQDTLTGDYDGFIVKYSPGGARQWGTYYGGVELDAINSMAINANNELIFCGYTDSSSLYTSNAHQSTYGGGSSDCFLGKMSPAGSILWATYYGGSGGERDGNDFQTDVKCDADNNIYLVGVTNSDTGIAHTSGIVQSGRGGDLDGFIAKFNTSGVRQWGTYYGGTYDDAFTNVAISPTGFVYVEGQFKSDSLGTSGTFSQYRKSGNNTTANNTRDADILVAKFNPSNGDLVWSTYYGGNTVQSGSGYIGIDDSRGIAVSDTSMVYFSGTTQNIVGIATSGTEQSTYGSGYSDAFLVKLDSNGTRIWGTYCGGNSIDHGGNVTLDDAGSIYITGRTTSTNNIHTTDGHQTSNGGGFDAMMVIYGPNGKKIWGSYYGGTSGDYGYSMSAAGLGHMYLCGNSESDQRIAYGGQQGSRAGFNDAFLAKFTPDTSAFIFQPFTHLVHCQEDSFTFQYGITAPFYSNNTFNVELSNSSGSFANPTIIGSVQTSTDGFIKCGIPGNVSGENFRIRIVSTSPIDTSEDNGLDIKIIALPAWPVASNNGPVCSNDTLVLSTTNSGAGVEYTWTGPPAYSNTSNDTFAYRTNMTASTMSGDYVVVADNDGCTRKDTTSVTIKQASTKPLLQSNAPLCQGDTLRMNVQNMSSGASLKWEGPNNWTDTATNWSGIPFYAAPRPNMQSANAGSYYVIAWLNGCDSRDTIDVTVGPRPAPVTASGNGTICSYDSIQLSAVTTTSGVVYNWYGPDTFQRLNQQNVKRVDPEVYHSGDYIAEANLNGCRVYDTVSIVVNKAPEQPIAGNDTTICTGTDFILDAVYSWPDTALDIWTIPNAGNYNDTDTVYNIQLIHDGDWVLSTIMPNGCTLRDTMTVTVLQFNAIPINIVADPGSTVCPGADLMLRLDPPQMGSQHVWNKLPIVPNSYTDFNDTVRFPQVKLGTSGDYAVEVTQSVCNIGRDTISISVVNNLAPPVLSLPNTLCEGDSLQVNISHPTQNAFTLYEPGGDSAYGSKILITDINKANHQGRYILKTESGTCVSYDTAFVTTVFDRPDKPVAGSNAPLCEGETLQLNATSAIGGVGFKWEGPASFNTTTQNPTLPNVDTPDNDGYYIAYATMNGCSSDGDSIYVEVHPNPVPSIRFSSLFEVCEGGRVELTLDSSVSSVSYVWSVINNPDYTGRGTGVSFDSLKTSDAGGVVVTATSSISGCTGSDTVLIDVLAYPDIPNPEYNGPLCEGERLELTVAADSTANVVYMWEGPGGYVFEGRDAFRNELVEGNAGIYYLNASRNGSTISCAVKDSVEVLVKPTPPEPQLANNGPLKAGEDLELKVLNPAPDAGFTWRGPNSFGSLVQDPIIPNVTVGMAGSYTLVTTLDGCESSSFTVVVIDDGKAKQEEVTLFPNPNDGNFTVRAEVGEDQIMPFEVISVLGTVVYSDRVQTQNKKMEQKIELSGGLTSGVYIFRILMSGKTVEIPFTVVR